MAEKPVATGTPDPADGAAAARTDGAPAGGAEVARRPVGRRILRAGIWSLVALLLLAIVLVFVAGRTVTLQWAAQQAVDLTGGRLQIEGITGSVLSEVAAESVSWQDGNLAVTVTAPRITYHPFALLDGLIRVERISAANVEVDLPPQPPAGEPRQAIRLPGAMALLLPVAIERIDAGRVVVRRAGSQVAKVHNLEAVLRHDGDRFNASLLNVDVFAGDTRIGMRGEASVLARAPYATDGRLSVQVPMQPQTLRVDVRINGPVEELSVRANATVAGGPVEARTVVHTLDPRPLRQVRLDLKDFDLSRFDRALPATRLTGSYEAEVMPAWARERQPLLVGPVTLANTLAGPIDRKRIPLSAAKAVVGYSDGRFEVQSLQASGPLGELSGDGWFGGGSFRIALSSERLQLRAINSTLAPRTLAATVAVEPITRAGGPAGSGAGAGRAAGGAGGAGGLSLDVKARDASLVAEMKAVLADGRLQIGRAQVQLKSGKAGGAAVSGVASFRGDIGVAAPWPISISGDFRDFDPGQLVTMPPALLKGRWRVDGRVAGSDGGRLKADVTLSDSRLSGLPLAGKLAASLAFRNGEAQRLSGVEAAFRWGASSIEATGTLGEATDALHVAVNLPKAGELQSGIAGAVQGQGTLRGALLAPAVEAALEGKGLVAQAGAVRVSAAAATLLLRTARLQSGVLDVHARLDDVDVGQQRASDPGDRSGGAGLMRFDRVTAAVKGTQGAHAADLEATGPGQRIVLAAKGGLADDGLWHGSVQRLEVAHPLLKMPVAGTAATAMAPTGTATDAAPTPGELRSLQPFVLTAGAGYASVRDARLGLQDATLNLRQLDWQDPIVTLRADATGVAARWLGRFVDFDALYRPGGYADPGVPGIAVAAGAANLPQDLRLSLAADFRGNLQDAGVGDWRGVVQVRREGGDLTIAGPGGGVPVRAGLKTFEASASIASRVLKVVANVDGEHIGWIAGEAQATLQGGDAVWEKASLARSPLAGRIEMATSSFRWISPLVGDTWRLDGALSARLQLAGTLGRPRVDGVVTGNDLSAREQALGMRLTNGVLAAELAGDRVDVKVLRFESGEGSVAVSGLLQAPGTGRSEARIVIDRLPIPLGAGQRVVLSGNTTATLEARTLNVSGRLVADEGVIELRSGDAPAVSSDVVIVDAEGRERPVRDGQLPQPADPAPADPARPAVRTGARTGAAAGGREQGAVAAANGTAPESFAIRTDVEIDLGRHFRAFGSGLEANLKGAIRLRGNFPEAPRATGTVELVNGTYQVYGRKLRIKRGRVVFNGPLDNPSLDIVAVRDHLKIEPGVEIGGLAASPVVRLISEPEVADAEKLSWLVLGTGLEDAQGAGQLLALQAAATSLFGEEDAKYAPGLTERLGIDLLSVREQQNLPGTAAAGATDTAQGAVVTVGKRLSSRLFVTYEQSLRGVWNILKLQYEITDRLSLSVQAGSDSALDVLWFFPFD